MTSLFEALVSTGQAGRIKPQHYTPTEGEWCMVLGSDAPGSLEYLLPGDLAAVQQNAVDWSGDVVRVIGFARLPAVPFGYSWELVIDLVVLQSIDCGSSEYETQILDFSANISELVTEDLSIGIRLVGPGGNDPVLVELPAFYIDTVTESTEPGDVALVAAFPAQGQTNVPASIPCGVNLHVAPLDSTLVLVGSVNVQINGVDVVISDAIQAPYTGSLATAQGPSALDTSIIITGGWLDFSSEELVTIAVQAETVGGALLDDSYTFTISDYAPPQIISARALTASMVELTFSEDVKQLDPLGAADALNPENYGVIPTTSPTAEIDVMRVIPGGAPDIVVLEFDTTMSFAPSAYQITATGVADIAGNTIIAPYNTVSVTGFSPDWPECRSFSLWYQLADIHRSSDLSGDLFRFMSCLQEVTDQLMHSIDAWPSICDPDSAAEQFIDAMLLGLGNPFDFILSLPDKRLLIASLVPIYKAKGTRLGVEDAVFLFLGFEISIVPLNNQTSSWILDVSELGIDTELFTSESATLYTFDVIVSVDIGPSQLAAMLGIINFMKPGHEHIGTIHFPSDEGLPNYWLLGLSELGADTELAQNG